jgi:hypothetical protein
MRWAPTTVLRANTFRTLLITRSATPRATCTNGLENFWSLLKRGIRGTYVSVEPFHLFRYLDEQSFRFNERELTDSGLFLKGIVGIIGKRLEYLKLIGKDAARQASGTWQTA